MYISKAEHACRASKTDLEKQGKVARHRRQPIKMMATQLSSEMLMDLVRRKVGHVLGERLLKRSSVQQSTCPLLCDPDTLVLMKASQVCQAGEWTESHKLLFWNAGGAASEQKRKLPAGGSPPTDLSPGSRVETRSQGH